MTKSILIVLLIFSAFNSFAQKRGNPADTLEIKMKTVMKSTNQRYYLDEHLNDAKRFPAMYYNQSQAVRDSVCDKLQVDHQVLLLTIFLSAHKDKKINAIQTKASQAGAKSIQMINEGVFTALRQQKIEDLIKKINELVAKNGFLKK